MPHLRLCQLTQTNSRDCQRPVPEDFPMDLCEMHALMTVAVMLERGGAAVKRVQSMYDTSYVRKVNRDGEHARPVELIDGKPTVVYYLKFGDRVKVGTTRNLPMRLQNIPHDEVLAIEPGDRTHERRRHLQFGDTRKQGEWFELDANMEDHAAHLRELYGQPEKAWRKWIHEANAMKDTPKKRMDKVG